MIPTGKKKEKKERERDLQRNMMEFSQPLFENFLDTFEIELDDDHGTGPSMFTSTDLTMMMMMNHDAFEPTPLREDHCHCGLINGDNTSIGHGTYISSNINHDFHQSNQFMTTSQNNDTTATTATDEGPSTSFDTVSRILCQDDENENSDNGFYGHHHDEQQQQDELFQNDPSVDFSNFFPCSPGSGEKRDCQNKKLEQWSKFHFSTMLMDHHEHNSNNNTSISNIFTVNNDENKQEEESMVMTATRSSAADEVTSSILYPSATTTTTTNKNNNNNNDDINMYICQQQNNIVNHTSTSTSTSSCLAPLYTTHQAEKWQQRFDELIEFKKEYGHCCVPSHWPQNSPLAQWVKRQRSQYKLKMEGKRSNMTNQRQSALEELGFVWDSHSALWEERLNELRAFRDLHGHCNIPTRYPSNQSLAIWAKCQRRQFKLYCTMGPSHSNMTLERIEKLANIGFVFNPRSFLKKK